VQQAEGQRRHCKEVHCGDGFAVVAQEGHPSLRRLWVARRGKVRCACGSALACGSKERA
jgi:hypothetical protein